MTNAHNNDNELLVFDFCKKPIRTNAPAPTGTCPLQLFPICDISWVYATIKIFFDP